MKYVILLLTVCLYVNASNAQDFVRESDKKTGKVLLRGKITFGDILNETSCSWLSTGAKTYHPNRDMIDGLNRIAGDYRFVVFSGTWCSDTKDLLPKFYKVLTEANIDLRSVEMYGVNRAKQALNIETTLYGIKNIPTIIIMHQFREVGRIVETVNLSIEEDLYAIMVKDYNIRESERAKKFN